MAIFKCPRITTEQRLSLVITEAEIVFDVDEKKYYGGDSITLGGIPIAGTIKIPEYEQDPEGSEAGDTWVLKSVGIQPQIGHTLLQFGLSFSSTDYFLKFKTISGEVVKTKLEV
jgi:hypothetical protein